MLSGVGAIVIRFTPSPRTPDGLTVKRSESTTRNLTSAAASHVARLRRTAPSTSLPRRIFGDAAVIDDETAMVISFAFHLSRAGTFSPESKFVEAKTDAARKQAKAKTEILRKIFLI